MIRAVGGNAWRMAHNPPTPSRLDITDALGMLALDENHYYGGHYDRGAYTPEDTEQENEDMSDLVSHLFLAVVLRSLPGFSFNEAVSLHRCLLSYKPYHVFAAVDVPARGVRLAPPYHVGNVVQTDQNVLPQWEQVRRDRSHASVWMYNACNEVGCDNETAAPGMRAAVDRYVR